MSKRFEMTMPTATASPGEIAGDVYRQMPARPASFESDVLVPASQAMITGLVSLLPTGVLTAVFGWDWRVALLLSGGVMVVSWLYLLNAHRKLLWLVEELSRRDVDGDGQVGKPAPPAPPVRLEVAHAEPSGMVHRRQLFELPQGVSDEMFRSFARRAPLMGISLAVWTGRSGEFSRAQFEALMQMLDDAGIVAWVNPDKRSLGRYLTGAGRAALRHFALPLG